MKPRVRLLTVFLIVWLAWLPFGSAAAQAPSPTATPGASPHPVYVYLFWGEGCPHCAKAKPYLESLVKKYPQMVLRDYEIYYHPENQQLLMDMAARGGFEVSGVPLMLFGPYLLVGYSEELNQDIEDVIVYCIQNGCPDAGQALATPEVTQQPASPAEAPAPEPTAIPSPTPVSLTLSEPKPPANPGEQVGIAQAHTINLPLLGAIDLDRQSLALSTALIALVDGFNPCSLWVLSMLMALVIHTGSRKKVMLIGLVFLTVTAAIYAIFIAGLFSLLRLMSFLSWIEGLVAVVALVFAVINIKDYFWFKEGLSFTISDEQKPGIFQKMRRVLAASGSLWSLLGATVVMAAGVSLVEFSCTAGLPVLWTNLLSSQEVTALSFLGLLLLYLLIYQLDELAIFGSVVLTLKASRLEEKQGRILKLFGGTLMLFLAIVMLVRPALMSNLAGSLAVFAVAFAVAGLVLLVHRHILPQLGIWIGSEAPEKPIRRR